MHFSDSRGTCTVVPGKQLPTISLVPYVNSANRVNEAGICAKTEKTHLRYVKIVRSPRKHNVLNGVRIYSIFSCTANDIKTACALNDQLGSFR